MYVAQRERGKGVRVPTCGRDRLRAFVGIARGASGIGRGVNEWVGVAYWIVNAKTHRNNPRIPRPFCDHRFVHVPVVPRE